MQGADQVRGYGRPCTGGIGLDLRLAESIQRAEGTSGHRQVPGLGLPNAELAGSVQLWEWIGDEPATTFSY